MPKIFDRVTGQNPRYSAFDLSREQKLSARMGELVPTYLEEVVPGDQFRVKSEVMMRLAPMISPVMHRVNVYLHYFFVPNRIIWNQWEDFITGGESGTSDPEYPTMSTQDIVNNRLADYLGLPTLIQSGEGGQTRISQLPFRAYTKIWNEYYRDQNLQSEVGMDPSPIITQILEMRQRAWEKDYFTSALPWAQRGPEVGIPVDLNYKDVTTAHGFPFDDTPYPESPIETGPAGDANELRMQYNEQGARTPVQIRNLDEEQINVDVNQLRTSSALQRWLEKSARGGSRYIETILSHFGVRSQDKRLQRPEYLGGGQQPIVISEVLNTTGTEEAPQGELAGHGISSGQTNSFQKRFTEHGYVMGIMSVLPRTAYQQGIPRHWNRFDRFDYYWPEFANLGEQEIKNSELYFDMQDQEYNEGTFGYQQRYAEYKYGNSTVHGAFRTNLSFWHMGRIFQNQPALNAQFVQADPTNRIFAVEDPNEDPLWIQMYHNVKARRPMPYFSNPQLK